MKKALKLLCVFLATLTLSLSASCQKNFSSLDLYYLNTQIHVQTNGTVVDEQTLDQLHDLFSSLEESLSASKDESTLSKFNAGKSGEKFPLDSDALKVFNLSKRCYLLTNGKFNPSVFPLVKLWDFFPNYPVLNFAPPTAEKIDEQLEKVVDFSLLNIDEENMTVEKPFSSLEIDFGGIVKGYALDKAANILKSKGHEKGYLSIGSSSLYLLESESLNVRHPRATEENNLLLSINTKGQQNLSVATSGDYEKSYLYEGENFSHIIDPKTGRPSDTKIASATIIGDNGGMLDALSTALCLSSYDGTKDSELVKMIDVIIDEIPSAKVFVAIIDGEQKILVTNQTEDKDFTLLDKSFTVVKL